MKKRLRLLVVSIAASTVSLLGAVPDAGQLLRDQQQQADRKPAQRLPDPELPEARGAAAAPSGTTVLVKGFRFSGHEGLATEPELQSLVQDAIGKSAGVSELQRIADKVSAALRAKGYFLARAYLPKQDVTGGIIQIGIIQARSDGGVIVNRLEGVRLRERYLQKLVDDAIDTSQPLHEHDLERALLLINDLPGMTARAALAAGSLPGTTRVSINVNESKLFTGSVWADNHGNRYTGSVRGNGAVSINDPFGLGDQFDVLVSGAEGLAQGRVAYAMPIGTRGLHADASYTAMRYKLIDGLAALKAKGTAQTVDLGLRYPLIRRRALSIHLTAGYEFKMLRDEAFGFEIRDKLLHAGTAGITGEHSDDWQGGGFTSWSVSFAGGNLDLSNNSADEKADKAGPGTAGSFGRFNLSVSRLQRLGGGLMLSASYYGQLAAGNLDSSEKFSLGGPYGVRAYPVGEASGDEGHLFNVELRRDLPLDLSWGNVQAIGFVDTGHVTLNKTSWPGATVTAKGENGYWLSGAGVGLSVSKPGRYSLRVSYGHKLGKNPGRTFSGMDADGRDSDGRVWAMAQFAF